MKRRPLVPLCAALIVGISAGHYFDPPWWLLAGSALAAAVFAVAERREKNRLFSYLCVYALVSAAGALLYLGQQAAIAPKGLGLPAGSESWPVRVRGTIVSDVQCTEDASPIRLRSDEPPRRASRFDLRIDSVASSDGNWHPASLVVRVAVQGWVEHVGYGDRIETAAALARVGPPSNPGGFDYSSYLREHGVAGLARVVVPDAIHPLGDGAVLWPSRLLHGMRYRLRKYFLTRLPGESKGVVSALVLGSKNALTKHWEQLFAQTGTMHFLAVSGQHVVLVGALGWFIGRRLRLAQSWTALLAGGIVVAYALMVGLQPSVLRATLTALALLGGLLWRRQKDYLNIVALAAILVLVICPRDLFDVGFQLSFAAVGFLTLFIPPLYEVLRRRRDRFREMVLRAEGSKWLSLRRRSMTYAVSLGSVSLVAWLGAFPLMWRTFHLVTPVAVLASPVVAPMIGLLLTGGLMLLMVGWVPGLGWLLGYALYAGLWLLGQCVTLFNKIPLGHFYAPEPAAGWVIAYYALAVLIAAAGVLRLRPSHLLCAALVLPAAFFASGAFGSRGHGEFRFTAIDVGHGSSVFCEFPDGKNLLYDAGGIDDSSGEAAIAPFLWSERVGRLDALILSHPDSDHINGVPALLERFSTGSVYVDEGFARSALGADLVHLLGRHGLQPQELSAGDKLTGYADASIEVLNPVRGMLSRSMERQNDRSVVLRIECRGRSLLLCGDVEEIGAAQVTAHLRATGRTTTAILLPHHGAQFQGLRGFVEIIRPDVGIASCGRNGVAPGPKEALDLAGIPLFVTGLHGAVRGRWSDSGMKIEQWDGTQSKWAVAEK